MKATGIVRRIDDLGRVVIPKEIRRTMRIREGDPLEIYTDRDGEVIFKKYSPIGEWSQFLRWSSATETPSSRPQAFPERTTLTDVFPRSSTPSWTSALSTPARERAASP